MKKIYTEQLDQKYVESWADRGGVGLADIIYNQLQERFFGQNPGQASPKGPMPIDKGTTIKIDETKQQGLPVITPKSTLPTNEVSFLFEWDQMKSDKIRNVTNPYDGEVVQAFRLNDDRQIIKLAHQNGLQSTISFIGDVDKLKLGDVIEAGRKLGSISPSARGLTWQVQQVGA